MSEDIKKFIDMLDIIINDNGVPKNIKRNADKMKKILSNEKEPLLQRVSKVSAGLETMGNDNNIPLHTRTMVWGLSSQLESISAGRR